MAEREPKISDATKAADRADADAAHEPDRMPTAEESAKAEEHQLDPDAAAHYEEMAERGAKQRGEGRVEG
jgi:hypothetical protein